MEGREQYRAERSIEDDGLAVLGIAHSHPSTAAFPSATDCAQLYWPVLDDGEYPLVHPQALRVIVSLRDPDAPEVRAFRLVEEVPVR